MKEYYLVIDQGGHSTRAIVFTKKGRPLAYTSEPVSDPLESTRGFVEYSSEAIIQATHTLLERLGQQLKAKQITKIKSAAIICQRSSFIACDKQSGEAVTPMISWQDTRNSQWLKEQDFDIQYLQKLTGLRLNAHAGASKMRWLLDNNTKVRQLAEADQLQFLPWGAFVLQQLTLKPSEKPRWLSDPVLAARTGLTQLGEMHWSEELLLLFNIPRKCLPTIVPTSHDYGCLSLQDTAIPVTLLGGDQNFIPYAYGVKNLTRSAFLNIGTGAFIQASSKKSTKAQHSLLKTAASIEDERKNDCFVEGTINAAATALDWWQEQLERPYSFGELDELLSDKKEFPLFINVLAGTGSPYWLPKTEPYFIEEGNKTSNDGQKTVAILESIIFLCKVNFDEIKSMNPDIKQLIVSGGLTRSDTLCQKLANSLNIEIIRYRDSEASARGVVFYQTKKKKYKTNEGLSVFTPFEDFRTLSRFEKYKAIMKNLSGNNPA